MDARFEEEGPRLNRTGTNHSAHAFHGPDPWAPKERSGWSSFINALLSTALFRCWHILLFFGAWSTFVTLYHARIRDISVEPVLLTAVGTVLGFVVSYRTTSSFERYNEGRRLWSTIILNTRTFARLVWFHVPNMMPVEEGDEGKMSSDEREARTMIEKKTIMNLLEGFAVAIKHYLRGENGIFYEDLYYLVKFLPAYRLPGGIPVDADPSKDSSEDTLGPNSRRNVAFDTSEDSGIPLPATSLRQSRDARPSLDTSSTGIKRSHTFSNRKALQKHEKEEGFLLPGRNPPKYHLFDLFPFSLLVNCLTARGKDLKGKKAARLRAKMFRSIKSHNLPLEISLYLSSYVAALQARKAIDPSTTTALLNALNQLVESLTGLERILTTPIPFSYSIHLWTVTSIYCLALPFQICAKLGYLTIPATFVASFMFFGFLVCGDEIENPFGYDKNDLNLDHFTGQIIRNELRGLTALARPDVSVWAFSNENDLIFASQRPEDAERVVPETWVHRGLPKMQTALST